MDTNVSTGSSTGVTVATDLFQGFHWRGAWSTAAVTQGTIAIACSFSKFAIQLGAAAGGGLVRTFVVQKNGVDSAVILTITDPATTGSDTTHSVSFSAGDLFNVRTSATGVTTSTGVIAMTILQTAAANTSMTEVTTNATGLDTALTNYTGILGSNTPQTNPVLAEQIWPSNTTFSNSRVTFNASLGAAGKIYTATLYKNGVSSAIVVVTNGGTTGSDLTHTLAVAAGDKFYWEWVPTGTPSGRVPSIAMQSTPTTNGESVLSHTSSATPSTSSNNFNTPQWMGTAYNATESNRWALIQACAVRAMYGFVAVAPGGVGKQYTIQSSIGGSAGNPQIIIANAAQSNSDLVNSVNATFAQTFSFKFLPSGTPAATNVEVAVVCFIQPPATNSGNMLLLF